MDKKHHRQKTIGNFKSDTFGLAGSPPSNKKSGHVSGNSFIKPNNGSSTFKHCSNDMNQNNKSIFEDPVEESRYLQFLFKEKYNLFENEQQTKQRESALKSIQNFIYDWQTNFAKTVKKISAEEAESRPARALVFGSYKLGVQFPDTDLDLVCVFPDYITKDDFFEHFKNVLAQCPDVKNILDIVDAMVPILKIELLGYQFDLLYAAVEPIYLSSQQNLEKLIKDENFFNKLNQVSQNSFNGLRTSQNLIRSVPNQQRFKNALRAVKLWALRRGVYSNTQGYLGGVSYTIMVAKICQDHPELEVADLLFKFFEVYADWKWLNPVFIKVGKKKDKLNLGTLQLLESYSSDLMPILTPNNNPKNSAYRVVQSNFYVMCKELHRARDIIKQLAPASHKSKLGKPINKELLLFFEEDEFQAASQQKIENEDQKSIEVSRPRTKWTKLFKRGRFFAKYQHFIKIDILSTQKEAHPKWMGYVEAQLRRLIQLLGDLEQMEDIRIYPKSFSREETKDIINNAFNCCDSYFVGIKLSVSTPAALVDLRTTVTNFCHFLEIGRVQKAVNNVRILHYRQEDLPFELINNY